MTLLQAIVSIIVAMFAASAGGFGFAQFLIKRKDDKEANDIQSKIDTAVAAVRQELLAELDKGLLARSEEGRERFIINSEQINDNKTLIRQVIQGQQKTDERFNKLAESITVLSEATASNTQLTRACAEGVRSTNYDRMLIVANNALKKDRITVSEKTNLKQLYTSWGELQGHDPKIDTLYEDCMKLRTVPDDAD